ncbi:DUF4376 domain-containing protein [bacterium]|nr:DUF4376 domain-containing protein [bacterium]
MFYRILNNKLLDWADYQYAPDCLMSDLITKDELNKNPEKIVIKEGKIVLNPEWGIIELDNLKNEKILENDTKRDIALNKGVEYKNILFDSDTDQKVNLLACIASLGDDDNILWFGKDNKALNCSKDDLINIGSLITKLHSFCWNKNAEIKEQISLAQNQDELRKIEVDYE